MGGRLMLRSMFSGISGMKVNQTKLDVIGNNIANVGTTAFKSSRTRFQDMLSQNAGTASGPSLNLGGVNPSQVGLGVQLAGIDTVVMQGAMQPTSRNLDMAVDGEGYFMVMKGPVAFGPDEINVDGGSHLLGDTNGRNIMYTRDGSFMLDPEGNLLTSSGYRVLGYSVTGNSMPPSVKLDNAAATGADINFPTDTKFADTPLNFKVTVGNKELDVALRENYTSIDDLVKDIQVALGSAAKVTNNGNKLVITAKNSYDDVKIAALGGGDIGRVGLTAGTKAAPSTRTEGGDITLPLDFTGANELKFEIAVGSTKKNVSLDGNYTKMEDLVKDLQDKIGDKVLVSNDGNKLVITAKSPTEAIDIIGVSKGDISKLGLGTGKTPAVATSVGQSTSSIDKDGNIIFVDADSADPITKQSSLKADEDLRTLRIPEKILYDDEGTIKELRVLSFTVEKNGVIKASCEGGKTAVVGQLAMASFKNPAGLEKTGGNLYQTSANSGSAVIRSGIGSDNDNSKGYGEVLQGALEMSNVDLAEQFTDMIISSRAFQASGKAITTGDEILQDIINLKR